MDEMYSYGLMNYNKLNITDNEDFQNVWHNKEYYLDYLTVNQNEKWNLKPVYENQKMMFTHLCITYYLEYQQALQ